MPLAFGKPAIFKRPICTRCDRLLQHFVEITVIRGGGSKYFRLISNRIKDFVSFCLVPFRAIS